MTSQSSEKNFAANSTLRQKTTKRYRGLVLTGTAATLLLGAAVFQFNNAKPAEAALPIKTPHVEVLALNTTDSFVTARSFTGEIHARRRSSLGFERPGKVIKVTVDDGAKVTKNQLLAKLDTKILEARKNALSAQLEQAQAVFAELKAGPRQEVIAATEQQVKELQAQVKMRQSRLKRVKELHSQKSATDQQLDDVRFDLEAMIARQGSLSQRLTELKAGTRIEKIKSQKAVIAGIQASIATVNVELEQCEIKAPFNGTVAMRYIDEGSVVNPSQPILELIESGVIEARIGVPHSTLSALKVGSQQKLISVEGESLAAHVKSILPELDMRTKTATVLLTLDQDKETQQHGRIGQIVSLKLQREIPEQGYWIPTTALIKSHRGLWACYALDSQSSNTATIRRCEVEILHIDNQRVYVRCPLPPKSLIIATGIHKVVPGQTVTH